MPLPKDLSLLSSRTIGLYAEQQARIREAATAPAPSAAAKVERQEARRELADQLVDMFAMVRANKRAARAEARAEAAAQREHKVTAAMALYLAEKARRAAG